MPESLNIVLDSHSPGSAVSGKVIVETDKSMKYESITVEFTGGAETDWTDGLESCRHRDKHHHHRGMHGCHCVHRKNSELYFSTSLVVWKKELTPDGLFPRGVSVFPFQFSLPQNIPSSFEGQNGWIRYILHGWIQPSRGTPNSQSRSVSVAVPVRQPPPDTLRYHRQWTMGLSLPEIYKHKQKVEFLNRQSGTITLSLDIDRTSGFAVGEELPLRVYLENNISSRVVLMASITRDEVYKFRGAYGVNSPPVTRKVTDEIATRSSVVIQIGQITVVNMGMTIPSDVGCFIEPCDCISLHYFLNLKVVKVEISPSVHAVSTSFPIVFTSDPQVEEVTSGNPVRQNLPSLTQGSLHEPASESMDGTSRLSSTKLCFSIPKSYENKKQVVSLTCKSGKVTLSLDMPQRTEFSVNEELTLCVQITNYATTAIMLIASVIKHAPAYTSRGNRTTPHNRRGYNTSNPLTSIPRVTNEINSVFSDAIYPGQSTTWRDKLCIPESTISDLRSPVTKFFLKFNLREMDSASHGNVYMSIPVSIKVVCDDVMSPWIPEIVTELGSSSIESECQQDTCPTASTPPLDPVTETSHHSTHEQPRLVSANDVMTPLRATGNGASSSENETLLSEPPPSYEEAVKYLSLPSTLH